MCAPSFIWFFVYILTFNFSYVSLSCDFLFWIEPAPFVNKLFLEEFFLLAVLLITNCSLIRIFNPYSYVFAIQA